MPFETLLGNKRIKDNLKSSLSKGRISHFYLISGPDGSGKHTLARLLAAAVLCEGQGDKPCMECPACRKVLKNLHPDVTVVDDPEKKTVPVELIRKAREDVFIRPNEGRRKVYIFPRGQDMGLPGQNALLKVLEEPPEYGVFLLLTDNPEKLLPTIRSRGTELNLEPVDRGELEFFLREKFPEKEGSAVSAAVSRSGGYAGQAIACLTREEDPTLLPFARALVMGRPLAMTEVIIPLEKKKRDELLAVLEGWIELTEAALTCRAGGSTPWDLAEKVASRMESKNLLETTEKLKTAANYLRSNVSAGAVCGYLQWHLV